MVIIEKLRIILRDNALEQYISQENSLISCFIKSDYTYYKKNILVENVRKFYDFFAKQTNVRRDVVLNNLYGRVSNIPVVDSTFDELPFN